MTTLNSRLQLALIKRKKSKNALQKGFTLIELLIVVVILGVLSSIALPAFLNQQAKAEIAAGNAWAKANAASCSQLLITGDADEFAAQVGPAGEDAPDTCAAGEAFTSTNGGKTYTVNANSAVVES